MRLLPDWNASTRRKLRIVACGPAKLRDGRSEMDNMVGVKMNEVINNEARNRYELHVEGTLAAAHYALRGNAVAFIHTVVPEPLQGQGIAGRLIKAALADVRRRGLRVIAECSYVARYIERHPEERDLLV